MQVLVVKEGRLGLMKKGEFFPQTNFVFDVVASVEAPTGYPPCSGFVYSIRTNTGATGILFITNTDAASPKTFANAACRVIPNVQYVKMVDTLWHRHVFNSCQEYDSRERRRKLTLAVCLGQQPDSDTWIINESLHINGSSGQLIPAEEQHYFWHPQYRPYGEFVMPPTLVIKLPLSLTGFQRLCATAKRCLKNNFASFFVAVASAVMGLHFNKLMKLQDECPIVLLHSVACGTGKTATLRAIKALFGDESRLQRGTVTTEALLRLSSLSSFPITVDDISSAARMEEISVTYFNASAHTTVTSGTIHPRGTIILSSNKSFVESDRNASRMVHIPFFIPEREVSKLERSNAEKEMKDAYTNASSSLGELIAIGNQISTTCVQEQMELLESVLPTMCYRTHKSYATVLAFAQLLAENTSNVMSNDEVVDFLKTTWVPEIVRLHNPSSHVFAEYLAGLLNQIQTLEVYEVLRFLRPNVKRGGIMVVAIYLSDASSYYAYSDETLLRQHIKNIDRNNVNVPIDFLRDTCTDVVVHPRKNGKKKKCVVIPHLHITKELLQKLYTVAGVKERVISDEEKSQLEQKKQLRLQLADKEQSRLEDEEQSRLEDEEQSKLADREPSEDEEPSIRIVDVYDEPFRPSAEELQRLEDEERLRLEYEERCRWEDEERLEDEESRRLEEEERCRLKDEERCRQKVEEKRLEQKESQMRQKEGRKEADKPDQMTIRVHTRQYIRMKEQQKLVSEIQRPNLRGKRSEKVVEKQVRKNKDKERKKETIYSVAELTRAEINKEVCPPMVCKAKKANHWIMCESCNQWFHLVCVNLTSKTASKIDEYVCKLCQ